MTLTAIRVAQLDGRERLLGLELQHGDVVDGIVGLDLDDVVGRTVLEDGPAAEGLAGDVVVRQEGSVGLDKEAAPGPLRLDHLDAVPVRLAVGGRVEPRGEVEPGDLQADVHLLDLVVGDGGLRRARERGGRAQEDEHEYGQDAPKLALISPHGDLLFSRDVGWYYSGTRAPSQAGPSVISGRIAGPVTARPLPARAAAARAVADLDVPREREPGPGRESGVASGLHFGLEQGGRRRRRTRSACRSS